ncbi:MAG TPA: CPBP family intramembrane glutamic endopeptidase [Desulfobacterales bacterium]
MKKWEKTPIAGATKQGPLIPRRLAWLYLAAEFTVLFVGIPVIFYLHRQFFGALLIPFILAIAAVCLVLLLADKNFDRRRLFDAENFSPRLQESLLVFIPWAAALTLAWTLSKPQGLFAFPRANLPLWAAVMVLYPLLSAYPQEIIFRTFLFHRYRFLFPGRNTRIVVSALAFGLAHLFFANWLAPTLSALGGFLIAATYAGTASTLQASIVHGLWGNLVFTIGLGRFFYGGAIP